MDTNVGVVLPSAGTGERMSLTTTSLPKQYIKILKKPLFLYSVEAFLAMDYVKKVILVADNVERMSTYLQDAGLTDDERIVVISGDTTRHRSIRKGLLELQKFRECNLKVVIVHDAVRPFVPKALVDQLVKESTGVGAAGPIRPLVSTVVRPGTDSFLEGSLKRQLYASSETPQAFSLDILTSAYSQVSEEEMEEGTECLQLVLNCCGVRAKLIPTEQNLLKVTYRQDIFDVEAILKENTTDVCLISDKETDVLRLLVGELTGRVSSLKTILGSPSEKAQENGKTYNTVVLLHHKEIQPDLHLLDFANLIDLDRCGLIVHIIDHASVDGLQSTSVYNLHRNSRKMAHHYEKLHKGVVVIHCVSSSEVQKLISIVSALTLLEDPQTFSGQTLFL